MKYKPIIIPLVLISILISLATITYADSSAWGMRWFVPLGDIGNSSLWLNFTLGDLGDSMPNNICFGLNGTGLCVGTAVQDLDMGLKRIFNVSSITVEGDIVADSFNGSWNGSDELIGIINDSWKQNASEQLTLINTKAGTGDCPSGYVVQNTTAGGVECVSLESIYYNVSTYSLVAGTAVGTIVSTRHPDGKYDSVTLNITESAGSPALDVRMNFTGIPKFNKGVIRYYTSNIAGDSPIIYLWNYDASEWESYPPMTESTIFATIEQSVFDSSNHIQDGIVQMRLYKSSNGNINNKYYVDWIAVSKGFGTPAGEEVDPYSIHKTAINDTQFYYDGKLQLNISSLPSTDLSGYIPCANSSNITCSDGVLTFNGTVGSNYNDSWINGTIDTKVSDYNVSVWSKIVLWFNDKSNYWNTTNLMNGTLAKTSDVQTWISTNSTEDRTYTDTRVDSVENFTMQDINDSIGNHSQWLDSVPSLDTDSTDDITTSGGTITGNLVINGILTLIGDVFNATVTEQYLNGSFLPSITDTFDIGNMSLRWNTVYANDLVGNLDCSNITNANYDVCVNPDTNTQLSDSDILALGYNHTIDIQTWVDANDDDTIYDDTDVRQSIIDNSTADRTYTDVRVDSIDNHTATGNETTRVDLIIGTYIPSNSTADRAYTDTRVDSMSNYSGEGAYDSDNFSADYSTIGAYTTVNHSVETHNYIGNCSGADCDIGWGNLTGVPSDIADGDDNTQLSDANILAFGFNHTTDLKLFFDSLYQTIGNYVTNNFLNQNYFNKTNSYNRTDVNLYISSNITALNESVKEWVYNGSLVPCVNSSNITCSNGVLSTNVTISEGISDINKTNINVTKLWVQEDTEFGLFVNTSCFFFGNLSLKDDCCDGDC